MARTWHYKSTRHARRRVQPGAPPGTLVVDPNAAAPVVRAMSFGPEEFHEETVEDLDRIPQLLESYPVTWINVDGLGSKTLAARKIEDLLGDDAADGVDRIVARQTLRAQSRDRAHDRLQPHRDLVFDHDVDHGMKLGIRQLDALARMEALDQLDALLLVEVHPGPGLRRLVGVVAVEHVDDRTGAARLAARRQPPTGGHSIRRTVNVGANESRNSCRPERRHAHSYPVSVPQSQRLAQRDRRDDFQLVGRVAIDLGNDRRRAHATGEP